MGPHKGSSWPSGSRRPSERPELACLVAAKRDRIAREVVIAATVETMARASLWRTRPKASSCGPCSMRYGGTARAFTGCPAGPREVEDRPARRHGRYQHRHRPPTARAEPGADATRGDELDDARTTEDRTWRRGCPRTSNSPLDRLTVAGWSRGLVVLTAGGRVQVNIPERIVGE